MSDVMLHGVLEMPYEMAMVSELSRRQFYQRAQQSLAELDALRARIDGALVVRDVTGKYGFVGKRVALVVIE